jgi:hypothetical protein
MRTRIHVVVASRSARPARRRAEVARTSRKLDCGGSPSTPQGSMAGQADRHLRLRRSLAPSRWAGVPPGIDGIGPPRPAQPRVGAGSADRPVPPTVVPKAPWAVHDRSSGPYPYPNSYESHERRLNNTGDAQNRVTYRGSTNSKGGHQCSTRSLADPIRLRAHGGSDPVRRPGVFGGADFGRQRGPAGGGWGAMADAGSHPHLTHPAAPTLGGGGHLLTANPRNWRQS